MRVGEAPTFCGLISLYFEAAASRWALFGAFIAWDQVHLDWAGIGSTTSHASLIFMDMLRWEILKSYFG